MKILFMAVLLFFAVLTSGCYLNHQVNTDQLAIKTDGGKIVECLGPGVYSDAGLFTDLKAMPAGALTFVVPDPQVATKDTQFVEVEITIQMKRKTDCESVKSMFTNWSSLANDDKNLQAVASNIVLQGVKTGTRQFTLEQLLDDRDGLAAEIQKALVPEAQKFSVEILSVAVKNVTPDPGYVAILKDKANLTAKIETEVRRQDLIKQQGQNDQLQKDQDTLVYNKQLLTEKAKTAVEVEIAGREGQKTAAANQVYVQNPQAFQLEVLARLQKVFGDKAGVLYPAGYEPDDVLERFDRDRAFHCASDDDSAGWGQVMSFIERLVASAGEVGGVVVAFLIFVIVLVAAALLVTRVSLYLFRWITVEFKTELDLLKSWTFGKKKSKN